jgi:LuxR family maltose regulon positive regulatory protein
MLVNGHLGGVRLSPREREVLAVMADHYTTDEAAGILRISPNTVKAHMRAIYCKLAVNSCGQAVRRARALELL